ncbi:MAG: AGE family epimerase/isomerase [Lachnospiraceae bacterium]
MSTALELQNVLADEIRQELTGHIIPFWENLRDPEFGGYYGYLDYDLKLNRRAEKGCILNSRILWFFSYAYETLQDPTLLLQARHAYAFLRDHCMDAARGGIYWSVSYDGEPLDTTKHTYNQAFAIYALSTYCEASGDRKALDLAGELFDLIETRMRDADGYLEAFDENFVPASNEKLSENGVLAERTMNTILHVVEAYTEYLRVLKLVGKNPDRVEKVQNVLREALAIVEKKIYLPEKKRLGVFFDRDYHSLIDLYSYGHDIEAAWLLDRAADVLGDPKVSEEIHPMTDILVEQVYRLGFDGHSIPVERENGVLKQDRVWWVQAEAINGFLGAFARHPEREDYAEAAAAEWAFIKSYVIDRRPGSEWFWYTDAEGVPAHSPIVEPWKCPYHNGRMCLLVIRRHAGLPL